MNAQRLLPEPHVLCVRGAARSGKTSLVRALLDQRGGEQALVTLGMRDRTLFRFLGAVVRSLAPYSRGALLSFNAMYDRLGASPDVAPIVDWLGAHIPGPVTIAVDNVEMLERSEALTRFLTSVVSRCPSLSWIFSGRSFDALPLDAWLAYGHAALPMTLSNDRRWDVVEALNALAPAERNLLRAVAPMDTIDSSLVRLLAGLRSTRELYRIGTAHPELFEAPPLRLHREVREYFLAAQDPKERAELRIAGDKLERARYFNEALELYARVGMLEELRALVERLGLRLGDLIGADALDDALSLLQSDLSGGVLGLKAVRAARRGHQDVAENFFIRAVESAYGAPGAEIEYAYACELLRRNRPDALPIFERLRSRASAEGPSQAAVRSALAQAYAIAGRTAEANEEIRFALHVLNEDDPCAPLVHNRAAYVLLYASQDVDKAETLAAQALADALEVRDYMLAVGALSILYVIACERDRPAEALAALEVLADCGVKLGNTAFVSYALITMLEYHVEAHDLEAIDRTMRALEPFDLHYDNLTTSEALLPSLAMRLGWEGDFERAYALLAPSAERAVGDDFRALREAEIAFFAAGAGRFSVAQSHLKTVSELIDRTAPRTHKWVRTSIYRAIACSLIGDTSAAKSIFDASAGPASLYPRLAAIREAGWHLHRQWSGEEYTQFLTLALERMHDHGAGGFAALFAALPLERAASIGASA